MDRTGSIRADGTPRTVLWQPEMMPPNSWLYPAILYEDRISTVVPWELPVGNCPEALVSQLEQSLVLEQLLGDSYIRCHISQARQHEEWDELLDGLAQDHADWIREVQVELDPVSRDWLQMWSGRAQAAERASDRAEVARRASSTWQRLLEKRAEAAALGAERAGVRQLQTHIEESERELSRTRLLVVDLGELIAELCREPRKQRTDVRVRLEAIATRVGVVFAADAPEFDLALRVMEKLLERAAVTIQRLDAHRSEHSLLLDRVADFIPLTLREEVAGLERADREMREALSRLPSPHDLEVQRSRRPESAPKADTLPVPDRLSAMNDWAVALLHAKSHHGSGLPEAVERHPAFWVEKNRGITSVLAPRRLMAALFEELSGAECDARGWTPMRGFGPSERVKGPDSASGVDGVVLRTISLTLPVPQIDTPLEDVIAFKTEYQPQLRRLQTHLVAAAEAVMKERRPEDLGDLERELGRLIRGDLAEVEQLLRERNALAWRESVRLFRCPHELGRRLADHAWSLGSGILVTGSVGGWVQERAAPSAIAVGTLGVLGSKARKSWLVRRAERQIREGPTAYLYEFGRAFPGTDTQRQR